MDLHNGNYKSIQMFNNINLQNIQVQKGKQFQPSNIKHLFNQIVITALKSDNIIITYFWDLN